MLARAKNRERLSILIQEQGWAERINDRLPSHLRRSRLRPARSAKRRLPAGRGEGFLRRHLRDHHPRHFRIESANTVAANDKIGWIEDIPLNEIQHSTIDLRPLRLHQIENEFRRSVGASVHNSNCGS
jgi:hypothetical protein